MTPSVVGLVSRVDSLSQLRFRIINVLAIFSLVASAVGLLVAFASHTLDWSGVVTTLVFMGLSVVVLVWAHQQRYLLASFTLVLVYILSTIFIPFAYLLVATLALVAAAIVGNTILFVATSVIVLAEQIIRTTNNFIEAQNTNSPTNLDDVVIFFSLITVSLAIRYFVNQTEYATVKSQTSVQLLEIVAEIGQILAKYLNLSDLLNHAIELIRERFTFYHVQVFLVNEAGDQAQLVASTGAVGQQLLSRRHQLAVGSRSVIGQVTQHGLPVMARSTDAVYYQNELLPETRAELALPIMDGEKIIGALDVQSRRADAFDPERVKALQVMSNLLGTSIQNARLFESQARSTEETKRLFFEAETNLREIRRLNQQLTKTGWEEYLRGKRAISGVTLNQDRLIADDTWTDNLVQAVQTRQPVNTTQDGNPIIAVPVMLGAEVIGAIEVEPDANNPQAETVEMIKAVAQRLALSLDKARLFEESQEATAQEQRINEIVGRFQTVTHVDDLLKITLTELSQSLGAKHGAIRLTIPEQTRALNGESS